MSTPPQDPEEPQGGRGTSGCQAALTTLVVFALLLFGTCVMIAR